MLEHKKIRDLSDYFVELNKRPEQGVYFYRINGYNAEIDDFVHRYYDAARKNGVMLEGKIPNPSESNLSYYDEMMGMDFNMDKDFIIRSLKKWLLRMNDYQAETVGKSIYACLEKLRASGKVDSMLKNAYIKFMCWLYYKFERIVGQLGENSVPKIIYEGDISNYELLLISILSNAGCDVVLLQHNGDKGYLTLDPQSELSDEYKAEGLGAFPDKFCLRSVWEDLQNEIDNERLYGTRASVRNCTNAWAEGKGIGDVMSGVTMRGNDSSLFYNCFCRINGAEDKLTYANELYKLHQELINAKRRTVIVDGEIPKPTNEEISEIRRGTYAKVDQMISHLAGNFSFTQNMELQRLMNTAFVDVMIAESKKEEINLNKLTNKAVYLLCWTKRYLGPLFTGWKMPEISCFIYMGGCKNDKEALFMSFLARLPVDVLILCPNLNVKCCLEDKLLYEVTNTNSCLMDAFPKEDSNVRIATVAYHAERELDTIMYHDSGIYRNRQYAKANVICLQTIYEEIKILWDQELKYRPSFSTTNGTVNMPVIFAKISGVKEGSIQSYWNSVKELITADTVLVKKAPFIAQGSPNPMKEFATDFFRNGKLQRSVIKNHPQYQYSILREDMQDYILDKLQNMIDQKLIKGIGTNGMEYAVVGQIMNLPKDIVRMIQKFDFTKKNPKMIYINTSETMASLEDAILVSFLNLIGFDIVFFVPTGYQSIEKYFNKGLMEEHQIGEYRYDMQVPDFGRPPQSGSRSSWRDRIFKRGK